MYISSYTHMRMYMVILLKVQNVGNLLHIAQLQLLSAHGHSCYISALTHLIPSSSHPELLLSRYDTLLLINNSISFQYIYCQMKISKFYNNAYTVMLFLKVYVFTY